MCATFFNKILTNQIQECTVIYNNKKGFFFLRNKKLELDQQLKVNENIALHQQVKNHLQCSYQEMRKTYDNI